jgi:SAM-dependent methyltransferase
VSDILCIPAPTLETQTFLDRRGGIVDLAWLELEREMHVLDLGCGTGGITRQIARTVHPGRVLGLDASATQLSFAVKQAAAEGVTNLDFVQGDAGNPHLPAGAFDVVVSHTLLMYLRDPIHALMRQREIVRPGGLVVALSEGDWGTMAAHPQAGALDYAVGALLAQIRLGGGDPEIGRKLSSLFCTAGFQDVHIAEAATGATVISGAELVQGAWLTPLLGVLRQAARLGLIDIGAIEEITAGIHRWSEQPGALLIWPRTVRAKARR